MFSVFGDSHSHCFYETFPGNVYTYPASSAKGLSNLNSRSGNNRDIIKKLNSLEPNSNVIMFFGKVDLDFIINYKYNTVDNIDYEEYIVSIANSYTEFVKLHTENKNVYICELPFTHFDDETMLESIQIENYVRDINSHLSDKDTSEYSKFSKVIPYDKRISLYKVFNKELKEKCKINKFKYLEINKYFTIEDGTIKIPSIYINYSRLDHHLSNNIVELFMKSLSEISNSLATEA